MSAKKKTKIMLQETELQLEQTTATPIEIEIDENSSSNSIFDFAPLKPSELNVSVAGGCLCANSKCLLSLSIA